MVACEHERFEVVKLLVDSGAEVNQGSQNGWRPLHIAVDAAIDSDCKHKLGRRVDEAPADIVVYLLWKGADPFSRTNDGQTPADIAREVKSAKLVNLLETYERAHNKFA
jgi:ankyrin repeat protein